MKKVSAAGIGDVLQKTPRRKTAGYDRRQRPREKQVSFVISPQLHAEFKHYVYLDGTNITRKMESMVKAYVMRKSDV